MVAFFSKETIISLPLSSSMPINARSEALAKRNAILSKVKEYIDEFLDPSKPTYVSNVSIEDILISLEIKESDYSCNIWFS